MSRLLAYFKKLFCTHQQASLVATIHIDGGTSYSSGLRIVRVPRDIEIYDCPDCGRTKEGFSNWFYKKEGFSNWFYKKERK
jgi:hypothetical protein